MRSSTSKWALAAIVGLAFGLLPVVVPAQAEVPVPDHVVRAGFFDETKFYEGTRFYPQTLEVNKGQTVRFDFYGFHTVTFLPGEPTPVHPPYLRADEWPQMMAAAETVFFPTSFDCGLEAPCDVSDLSAMVNSGPGPEGGFLTQVNLDPGRYRYHCLIHKSMHGFLNVVEGAPANPTDADVEAQIAADSALADAVVQADEQLTLPVDADADGNPVYQVKVGDVARDPQTGDAVVSILRFMPSALDVPADAKVRYVASSEDIHTATFSKLLEGGFMTLPVVGDVPVGWGFSGVNFIPACDFDDVSSGAPGIPFGPPCLFGITGNFEILLSPVLIEQQRAPLDSVVLPVSYHNSGVLFAEGLPDWVRGKPAGSGQSFPSVFEANFPAGGTFTYFCGIHTSSNALPLVGIEFPGMQGSINVT